MQQKSLAPPVVFKKSSGCLNFSISGGFTANGI
jgi:hypothetical protein